MSSKLIFFLAIIITGLGVATVFFDLPLLEENLPFSISFFQGFLIGLGPTLFATAYVRRKKEQEQARSVGQ